MWLGRANGISGNNVLWMLLFGYAAFQLCGLGMSLGMMALGYINRATVFGALFSLFCAAPLLIWAIPRLRPSLFLSTAALIARTWFGEYRRHPLAELEHIDHYTARYRGKYGRVHEVATNMLQLRLRDGRTVLWGPTKDSLLISDLLHHVLVDKWLDLTLMPDVRGAPAPAELRDDLFVCVRSKSDGFDYGPLFVGPTLLVRFTDEFAPAMLARLFTLLGRAHDGLDAQQQVDALLKTPMLGHFTRQVLDETTRPSLQGARLLIASLDNFCADLDQSDAERMQRHLLTRQKTAAYRHP